MAKKTDEKTSDLLKSNESSNPPENQPDTSANPPENQPDTSAKPTEQQNKPPETEQSAEIKARVLCDCVWGKVNDVVSVLPEQVDANLDTTPEAVAYAESVTHAAA